MKATFGIFALIGMIVAAQAAAPVEPQPSPMQAPKYKSDASCKLVAFDEDFRTTKSLNANKWEIELQGAKALDFATDGLRMHLWGASDSSVIGTKQTFKKGTFTVRMRASAAPGIVSTAVVRPVAAEAQGGDEIDIVEVVGVRPTKPELVAWRKAAAPGGAAQYISNNNVPGHAAIDFGKDTSADFHNYTSVWDSDNVSWYYDGKWVYTVPLAASGAERLTQDMRFKFGPWVSSLSTSWSGTPDFARHPDPYMTVQSVHIEGCQVGGPALVPIASSSSTLVSASSTSVSSSSSASVVATATGSASVTSSAPSSTATSCKNNNNNGNVSNGGANATGTASETASGTASATPSTAFDNSSDSSSSSSAIGKSAAAGLAATLAASFLGLL